MGKLSEHQSNSFTKLLLLGDAKSGKTTSLVSLVEAGYLLRILDMDNLLDPLKEAVLARCPEKIENVEFVTLRDKRKSSSSQGIVLDGTPKAFVQAAKMIDHWKEGSTDLGRPDSWGPECILVLDSLSRFSDAAYDFRDALTPVGKQTGEKNTQATYHDAQEAVENTLAHLTSETFRTNVIVICHGQYIDLPDGTKKIFPQGVGTKLSPKIPQYFPVYVRYIHKAEKRTIQYHSNAMIDLAMPGAGRLQKELSTDDGLRIIFETLRSAPSSDVPAAEKPKSLTLRRI